MMLGENTGSPQGGRRKTCSHLIALMSTTVVLFLSCLKGRGAAAGGGEGEGRLASPGDSYSTLESMLDGFCRISKSSLFYTLLGWIRY